MGKRITSVTVGFAVKDVKEATKWYKKLFGDVEVIEPAPGTIELQVTEDAWIQLDDTGYLELGKSQGSIVRFGTEDLKAIYELAKEIGEEVSDITVVEGVVSLFDFKDPWGNKLSYYQMA